MLSVLLSALLLLILVAAAAGCGSSKTSSTASVTTSAGTTTQPTGSTPTPLPPVQLASGKPLTRAQWLTKGDAICAHLNSWLAANPVKSAADFATVLPQAASYEYEEYSRLSKLVPPRSQDNDWQQFLTETKEWAQNSEELGRTAQAQGASFTLRIPLVEQTKDIHEHLAHLAKRDGFKECSLV